MPNLARYVGSFVLVAACTVQSDNSSIVDGPVEPPAEETGDGTTEEGGAATDDGGSTAGTGETDAGDGATTTGDVAPEAECGNGVVEEGENCDGDDLGDASCATFGFESGAVTCDAGCNVSAQQCFTCGDGEKQDAEMCDGANLFGQSCETLGFGPGEVACSADCMAVDTAGCEPAPVCGDGTRNGGEACDGDDLGDATCLSLGYADGTLACADDCSKLVTDGCPEAVCGDGEINGGEVCDGIELAGETCVSQGFDFGLLACGDTCAFETSGCTKVCREAGQACSAPDDCCNTGCGKGGCNRIVNGQTVCCT